MSWAIGIVAQGNAQIAVVRASRFYLPVAEASSAS